MYLREQCEQIETMYGQEGITCVEREVMRVNNICVLSDSKRGVAYDFVNELYNLWLKQTPTTPFIDTAVERSRHTIVQRFCAGEMFNTKVSNTDTSGRSENEDRIKIECVLTRAGVFTSTEKETMELNKFWKCVWKPKNCGTNRDRAKEVSQLTKSEELIRDRIRNADAEWLCDEGVEEA